MLDPVDRQRQGPVRAGGERPSEAVDRLARLYDEATQALRGAVERFLKDGEPPSTATRALFRYPELRLTYAPNGPALSSPRAFAKFSEPGVYATTVTQPAEFRAYLLEQLEPLVERIRRHDRGRRRRAGDPLPLRDRKRRRADARRRRRRRRARALFSRALAGHDRRRNRGRRVRLRPPSGRSPCSTRRASIIRCAASSTTPAPTGGRCSPGCCSPTITAMSTSSCSGA